MSSLKLFFLLRLPLVALQIVIRQLDAFETIDLYIACNKAAFLKRLVRKPEVLYIFFGNNEKVYLEVQFEVSEYRGFRMREPAINNYDRRRRIKKRLGKACELESRERIELEFDKSVVMYWSNKWKGTIEWTEMLIELYQLPVMIVYFFTSAHLPPFMWEWLTKDQSTRRAIRFEGQHPWNRNTVNFLKKMNPRDDVYLQKVFKTTFDMTLTATRFTGYNTLWIRMDSVFNLDCEIIVVFRSSFFDSELTSFVRHWLDGGNPRLQGFFVQDNTNTFSEDPMKILDGLECNYEVFSDPKTFKVRFRLDDAPQKLTVEKGVIVHRSDGATLTIKQKDRNDISFFVSPPDDEELHSQRNVIQIS